MVAESAILKGLMPPSEHNSSLCAITYDVMFRSAWGALHLRDVTADMIGTRPSWLLLEKRLEFGECLALPVLLLIGLSRNVVDNGWMVIGQCMRLLSAGDGSIVMSLMYWVSARSIRFWPLFGSTLRAFPSKVSAWENSFCRRYSLARFSYAGAKCSSRLMALSSASCSWAVSLIRL